MIKLGSARAPVKLFLTFVCQAQVARNSVEWGHLRILRAMDSDVADQVWQDLKTRLAPENWAIICGSGDPFSFRLSMIMMKPKI